MNDEHGTEPLAIAGPAYRLACMVDGDVLKVRVEGELDAQPVRLAYWREIVRTARERHCRKLLVIDRRKGRPATPEELAGLADAFRDLHDAFDRVGVVEPTAEFLPAIEHAEIFARSLGINVRVFADAVSAERWVRFGSADDTEE
jgi:hypothetical protein